MRSNRFVLLVEDNDDHAELVRRAFTRHAADSELCRFSDAEQARAYLSEERPRARRPDLILLDLRLPRAGGLELLAEIKRSDRLQSLPVVMWSTSDNRQDITDAYRRGANAYLVKPGDLSGFDRALRDLSRFWLEWNRLPEAEHRA